MTRQGLFQAAENSSVSLRQFLQHRDNLIGDALARAGFRVAMITRPNLIAAQLVSFEIWQISDPVIGQFRDIGVAKWRTILDVEAQLREIFGWNSGDRHIADQEDLQPRFAFLSA